MKKVDEAVTLVRDGSERPLNGGARTRLTGRNDSESFRIPEGSSVKIPATPSEARCSARPPGLVVVDRVDEHRDPGGLQLLELIAASDSARDCAGTRPIPSPRHWAETW